MKTVELVGLSTVVCLLSCNGTEITQGEVEANMDQGHFPDDDAAVDGSQPRLDLTLDLGCADTVRCSELALNPMVVHLTPRCQALPTEDDSGAFRIADGETWAEVVRTCVWGEGNQIPAIDWVNEEILGVALEIQCPIDRQFLGVEVCGGVFLVHLWAWSDFCFCDYLEGETKLFVVDRKLYHRVEPVIHMEVPCEAVVCDCGSDMPAASGCDVGGQCRLVSGGDVDGVPPVNWSHPAACE